MTAAQAAHIWRVLLELGGARNFEVEIVPKGGKENGNDDFHGSSQHGRSLAGDGGELRPVLDVCTGELCPRAAGGGADAAEFQP